MECDSLCKFALRSSRYLLFYTSKVNPLSTDVDLFYTVQGDAPTLVRLSNRRNARSLGLALLFRFAEVQEFIDDRDDN
jgi:hypothetical protein